MRLRSLLYGLWYYGVTVVLAILYILYSLAVRALHLCPPGKGIHSWGVVQILAISGTAASYEYLPKNPAWLPAAVGLGALVHLIGDCLTKEGCPLLWPLDRRVGIPLIKRTGDKFETAFLTPVMALGAVACVFLAVKHPH